MKHLSQLKNTTSLSLGSPQHSFNHKGNPQDDGVGEGEGDLHKRTICMIQKESHMQKCLGSASGTEAQQSLWLKRKMVTLFQRYKGMHCAPNIWVCHTSMGIKLKMGWVTYVILKTQLDVTREL